MRKTVVVAALAAFILIEISAHSLQAQVAPGGNADANHPAGPPDPQKIDAVWQVDPISDQVTVNIPFATTPQGGRGPKLPFALLYNSGSTVTLQNAGSYLMAGGYTSTIYDWSTQPISGSSTSPSGPWTTTGPYIYYSVSNYPSSCTVDGPWIYVDENGSPHDMNLISTPGSGPGFQGLTGTCYAAQEWLPPQTSLFTSPGATSDGSSIATYNTIQSNGAEGEVIGPDGTSATGSFELPTGPITPATATLTDPNGNSATLALSSGVYTATDALGRTVYTTNIPIGLTGQIPAETYYVKTYNESGNTETYNVTFSQYHIGSFTMPHPLASEIGPGVGVNSPGQNPYNTFTAVSEIELPDTTSYQFAYDPTYGTISKITFPTGGYVRFCWGIRDKDWSPYGVVSAISSIVVIDAFTSTGTGTPGVCSPTPAAGSNENQWAYAMLSLDNSSVPIGQVTAPDSTYSEYVGTCFDFTAVTLFGGKETCKEYSRAMYDSSNHLKKSIVQNFNLQGVPMQLATTLYDGPSPVQQLVNYALDSYNNVTEKDESDLYSCTASPLCPITTLSPTSPYWIRHTYTQYSYNASATLAGTPLMNSAHLGAHIVNKPAQVSVTGGTTYPYQNNPYSVTDFQYDNLGNLLTETKCISFSGTGSSTTCGSSYWQTAYTYDSTYHQLQTKTEGFGTSVAAETQYTWTGQNNGFLTQITHPKTTLVDNYTYFTPTGQLKTHVDWNGNVTTYDYSDSLNRIKSIVLPATQDGTCGGSAQGTTSYTYTDEAGAFAVEEQHTLDSCSPQTTSTVTTNYDGLGRLTSAVTAVPTTECSAGEMYVETAYDSMSRVQSVTNPYCTTSDPTYGLTQYAYDGISRKIQTTYPDGFVGTISYSGAATEATDPFNGLTNVQHIQQADGLGRLINVCEVSSATYGSQSPAACSLSISGTGYLTTYTFDPLGNMTAVNQHGQMRSFAYDGLSRLTSAQNPETGTNGDTYTYSTPSKLCAADEALPCTRTDGRGVITTYKYDNMERLIGKSYSVASSNTVGGSVSDLTACYQFDTQLSSPVYDLYPKGTLTLEWEQPTASCPSAVTSISSLPSGSIAVRIKSNHDSMGRVGTEQQCLTESGCSPAKTPPVGTVGFFNYSHNLLGNLVQSNNGIYGGVVSPTESNHLNGSGLAAPSVTWQTKFDEGDHVTTMIVQDQPGTSVWSPTYYSTPPTLLQATHFDAFGHMTGAGLGIAYPGTGTAPINVARAYDNRGRITSEQDVGSEMGSQATQSLGTIQVSGTEQVSGSTYDSGTITVTINGTATQPAVPYGQGSTAATITSALMTAIQNADSSFLATIKYGDLEVLTSTNTGSGTDWTITASVVDTAGFSPPSFTVTTKSMVGGTSAGTSNGVLYSYKIPDGGYAPNGNILAHSDSVMGDWMFTYDALDRLSTATVTSNLNNPDVLRPYTGSYGCWAYDSYGNRTSETMSTTSCSSGPPKQSWAEYNAANNQMTTTSMTTGQANPTSSGDTVVYDASGDVLQDGYNEYWYDAEGRICASYVAGGGAAYQYVYDPEGARIEIGSLTTTPTQVPVSSSSPATSPTCAVPTGSNFSLQSQFLVDLGDNQVTELNTSPFNTLGANGLGWEHSNVWIGGRPGATYDNWGVHFSLEDPLGTKRVVADVSGQWDETCTTLPFGNDVGNPLPTNIVYNGYPGYADCMPNPNNSYSASDGTEHRFTNKEWDPETGNDYFLARYYSSAFGRFMSPDWSAKEAPVPYAVFADPQSLNLYAYVRNNPLVHIDADGHQCKQGDRSCNAWDIAARAWNSIHQIISPAPKQPTSKSSPEPTPGCSACPHGGGVQVGVEAAAGAEAGGHGAGAAATGSLGAGVFAGGDKGVNGGVFGTYGVHATGVTNGGDPPQTNSPYVTDKPLVAGAGATGGLSGFLTNATSAQDLNGIFSTTSFTAAFGAGISVQISVGQNDAGSTIWMVSGGPAGGLAAYESSIVTNTVPITPQ